MPWVDTGISWLEEAICKLSYGVGYRIPELSWIRKECGPLIGRIDVICHCLIYSCGVDCELLSSKWDLFTLNCLMYLMLVFSDIMWLSSITLLSTPWFFLL